MTERWRSRLKSTPETSTGCNVAIPWGRRSHGPPTSSRRGWHVQTYLGAGRLVVRQVSGSHLSPEGYRFPGTPAPIIPGPSPAGDRAGCPGGLAERSAAPTEASLACVSHWKTAPVPSRRPTVAGRSRPWSCVCAHVRFRTMATVLAETLPSHRHRVCHSGGMASTPPQVQRHPRPHTAPVRPLTIPVPMLLSGRPTQQRLPCGLCRCGGAPVRAGPRLVHRATRPASPSHEGDRL